MSLLALFTNTSDRSRTLEANPWAIVLHGIKADLAPKLVLLVLLGTALVEPRYNSGTPVIHFGRSLQFWRLPSDLHKASQRR